MGNCVQSSSGSVRSSSSLHCAGGGEGGSAVQLQRRRSEQVATMEGHRGAPAVVKVKMVLTKAELGWLVARLKRAGDRRLEDVLHEMVSRKKRGDGWRPSLESIVECPAETAAAATDS